MNFSQVLFVLSLAYGALALDSELTIATTGTPCTAEVLRSSEVQAFAHPHDIRSYIICTDIDVYEIMPCAPGTFFEPEIRFCVPDGWVRPVCPTDLCKNDASCVIDTVKSEYKCICRTGFTGLFCEINIDECALGGHAVCDGGKCIDQLNGFYCLFGDRIGLSSKNLIEQPCTLESLSLGKQFFELVNVEQNVFLQCTGENTFVVSKCAEMLFWNQEFLTCTIDRPGIKTGICKTYPCKNEGECVNLDNNNFQCVCKEGYVGRSCETLIDHCAASPCVNGGRCESYRTGYNCVCPNLVIDESCASKVENPCQNKTEILADPLNRNKYFLCAVGGIAFSKNCALDMIWNDNQKTCVALKLIKKTNKIDFSVALKVKPLPIFSSRHHTVTLKNRFA